MKTAKTRAFFSSLAPRLSSLVLLCCLPACQQQMAKQPSYRPDEPSSFFADGRAARPVVPGTVARGHLRTDMQLFEGKREREEMKPTVTASLVGAAGGNAFAVAALANSAGSDDAGAVRTFPFPVTEAVLRRGRDRYMIYCVVCHDALGTGRGIVVERGYTPPPSYHIERLRAAPVGHFFEVVTKGYGSMPSYRNQIPAQDRWSIIAYVRALQLSQHFPVRDLPDDLRKGLAGQDVEKNTGGIH